MTLDFMRTMEPSWYVVDFSFEAPHDAGEGHRHAVTPAGVRAALDALDPEELLCDLGVWVVLQRQVVDLVDLRPFVAISDGEELRWSDPDRFIERFEATPGLVPRVVWSEVAPALPPLSQPLLEDVADDWVLRPEEARRLARARGLRPTWTPTAKP